MACLPYMERSSEDGRFNLYGKVLRRWPVYLTWKGPQKMACLPYIERSSEDGLFNLHGKVLRRWPV